jgi:integrase
MPRSKKSNRADGRYQIRRVVSHTYDGKAVYKSFYGANKSEAEQKYRDFVESADREAEKKKDMLFNEWAETWLQTYKREEVKTTTFNSTYLRPYRRHIEPYFAETYIRGITALSVKAFLNTLSDFSKSYKSKVLMLLNSIFESAIDNDVCAKNPCRSIKVKGEDKTSKRTYDRETVERLCATDAPYALYMRIFLRLGLRASELCGLRWEDIDFAKGVLRVEQALTSEGGAVFIGDPKSKNSRRRLDVPQDLLQALQDAYNERKSSLPPSDAGLIYVAYRPEGYQPPGILARRMQVFYNNAGVPKDQRLSPHELRHTCGTLLYNETKDIYHVSRFLGHSDVAITAKIYVHSTMNDDPIHIDF